MVFGIKLISNMFKKFFQKNWLIIIILVIASFLRLYKIADYMEFLGDQGRDVVIIKDFWKSFNLFFIVILKTPPQKAPFFNLNWWGYIG